MSYTRIKMQKHNIFKLIISLVITLSFFVVAVPVSAQSNQNKTTITAQQAKALLMLNQQLDNKPQLKNLRVKLTKLTDSQGQVYLGALVSRAELSSYLSQLKTILNDDFQRFRANQAARDHQSFHMTILSPKEYQLADKALIEQLLSPNVNSSFSSQLKITLLGLGKVAQNSKKTYFVVTQSSDAQLIRQRFLLKAKDFHVTLGFDPSDIYGVKKDHSTLIKP